MLQENQNRRFVSLETERAPTQKERKEWEPILLNLMANFVEFYYVIQEKHPLAKVYEKVKR